MLGIGHKEVSARRIAWRLAAPMLLVLGFALLQSSPAGAIFGASSTISAPGVMASQPRIATDSQNNALIVWTEDAGGELLVRAAFRPAGGSVQPLGFLSAPGGNVERPLVVFDEHDNALVVWTRYEGPGDAPGRVQAAFRPAGGNFGPAETISGAEPGVTYYQPHFDVDESATVVWTRVGVAGEQSVQAAFRPKGGSFGASQTLSGPEGGYEPQVAVDERGNSLAVWTNESALAVHSAFRPRTGDWSTPVRISTAGHQVFSPRVAVDGRNNVMAVWTADDDPVADDPNFIQAALRLEGGSFAAAETISNQSGTADDPQVVFDKRDNALVAWTRFDGSVTRVETSFRPQAGGFELPRAISPAGEDAFEPRIAVDESAAVVWSTQLGDQGRVQGAFRQKDGTFGAPQTLSEPGAVSFEPSVAVDERGDTLAVWSRNESTDFPVVQFSFRPRTGSFAEPGAVSAAPPAGAIQPQIATDCWSNAIAVWTVDPDVNDPSNPTRVEAAFAPAGGRFGPPQQLSDPSRNASEPNVAFENDGDAVITWTGEDTGGTQRIHASFRPAGNGFGPAQLISQAGSDAFRPHVSAGRGTVVVWSRTSGANVIAEAAVKPENESFLPIETLSPPGLDAHEPRVSVGRNGTAVATWYAGEGDHVAGSIGRTSPGGFGPAATLSPPGMAASAPQVAVDELGGAQVVWIAGNGAFIQAASRPPGGAFAAAETISAENIDTPQVTFDESGTAIAVWTRYATDIGQIETASRPRGGAFGEPVVISGAAHDNYEPRVAADDSAAVVWTARTSSGSLQVESAFRPKGGAFGPVQTLTGGLLQAFEPQIAVDERGNALAVWTLTDQFAAGIPSTIQSAFRPRI